MNRQYWPCRGSDTGARIGAFDWSRTSLGPIAGWPQRLRTVVDIVLDSPLAMVLVWGDERVMLYNDGYAAIAGRRHPGILGATVRSAWPELWDWLRKMLDEAFRGQTCAYSDQHVVIERNGAPEDAWFDLFFAPVRDERSQVCGVLCTVIETTARVLAKRRQNDAGQELRQLNQTLRAEREAVKEDNRRLHSDTDFLRGLFEQAPSFMALLRGPDHVFELGNAPYMKLIGHRDIIGKPLRDALPELAGQGFLELLDEAYQTGKPFVGKQLKVMLRMHDEGPIDERLVDFVFQPIRGADGRISGVFVEGSDVTERAAAEERLRIAQEAGGIGTFEWFPDSGSLAVSDTYRRLWGIPREAEVTADLLIGLVDPADRHLVAPARLEGLENPLEYVEYRIIRPDTGEKRWLARQGEVVRYDGQASRRYVGIVYDITERKQRQSALRASEARLAAIFGQVSVGLSELNLHGRFTRVNDALCRMLGRTREEMLRLDFTEISNPDDMYATLSLARRAIKMGESFTIEKHHARPDGSRLWLSTSINRVVDEHGRPQALIAVTTDITERRTAEQALRDLNETLEQRIAREVGERTKTEEALRQAQKMEAVGQLTGGVAHDFNNVLQIIAGNLQLLHMLLQDNDQAKTRLDAAVAAVERGAKISSQLLAFARRQPLQPVVTDLGRLLPEMSDLLQRALGDAITVETVIADGLWNTMIDRAQLENVILNMAINARDAMRGQGTLTFELANAFLEDGDASAGDRARTGQYVSLSIADTGAGMSAETLEKAFEPFFTTKPAGEGTGLGLSMAYGFIKQSGGHIKIDSRPGKGTTVSIYLPRSAEAAVETSDAPDDDATGGKETILVVEDDVAVRSTVVDMLTGLGYRVLKAENGQSAMTLLKSGTQVDLLFTDVVMPGPVGSAELVKQAKQLLPDIGVLFTSGYTHELIMHAQQLDPGVELLRKPYRREDLARRIRHMLANKGPARLANAVSGAPLRVLVVEDNAAARHRLCDMLAALGHEAEAVPHGGTICEMLEDRCFDVLLVGGGERGIELAGKAVGRKPALQVIFVVDGEMPAADRLDFQAVPLAMPYDLVRLRNAFAELASMRR